MTRILRSAFVSVFAVGVAASLTGCKVDCSKENGATTCIGETTVQYISSTPVLQEAAWTAGQALRIGVTGGNVRTGQATTSITINPQGADSAAAGCKDASKVCVRFTAANNDTKENRDEATRQMKVVADGGNLVVSAANSGTEVIVKAEQSGKFNSALTALVDVWVPAAFDGDIVANSDSGGISVRGARKGASVKTGLGDIAFDLNGIAPNASSGSITTSNGDILFNVPRAANINVQGQVSGPGDTVRIDTVDGWKLVDSSTEQAATFCGNTACTGTNDGLWQLKATDLGSIQVSPKL